MTPIKRPSKASSRVSFPFYCLVFLSPSSSFLSLSLTSSPFLAVERGVSSSWGRGGKGRGARLLGIEARAKSWIKVSILGRGGVSKAGEVLRPR